MKDCRKFYINGSWVAPKTARDHQVINPSTEEPCGTISLGAKADVDDAVAAARRAFTTFSQTTREQRLELLQSGLYGLLVVNRYRGHRRHLAKGNDGWHIDMEDHQACPVVTGQATGELEGIRGTVREIGRIQDGLDR